ncbi:DUF2061 domain-containing protein [Sedimentitalea todarodis]|uniref:DUF2061 domain-containing protein n=1 Tax=Sedimentitalea todarodis TaxID=1631240 RepID=A0ABU3VLU3_9RHOB|nr:DUF2061 domain-containing protein [Sedimentitalea todarodis]MDU9007152.1 DUF2061 domain-containing protein [Sedimentitalea todarodis]
METRQRSLVKALIWNLIGLSVMVFVGYLATGSFAMGGSIAVVNTLIGVAMYVVYERFWARIRWGRHV